MASSKRQGLTGPGLALLRRPLTQGDRGRIEAHVRALLAWQRDLEQWPRATRAPDAMPFVAIYARGRLRGCFGSHEGTASERLTRAFLRALEDARYGRVRGDERGDLAVTVSYLRDLRVIDPARVVQEVEPGRDGLLVTRPGAADVVLLPAVARETRSGAAELLALLARKAKLSDWAGTTLYAIRTDDVIVRSGRVAARGRAREPLEQATEWLARLVAADGAVTFAVDARRREALPPGRMHHGRAAVAVRALARQGHAAAYRARGWLERSIDAALQGRDVPGWPADPAMVAGTLAMAQLAGLDVRRALLACSSHDALRASPWHAAQVVAALGRDAPDPLWRACVDDLAGRPWAPWTLVAARARGDGPVVARTAHSLVASSRTGPPHEGGCGETSVPEVALTALVVEALEGLPDAAARAVVRRARSFLSTWQLLPGSVPAALEPSLAAGAFPMSPIAVDVLRCDVTAHAVLALG